MLTQLSSEYVTNACRNTYSSAPYLLLIGRTCHVGLQIHGEIHKHTVKSQGRRQRTGDTSNCGQLVDGWGGKRAWRNTLAEINIYYLRLGAESQIQEILHSMGCGARNVCFMKRTRVDQDWKYIYNLMRVEVESQNKQQKYRRWWAISEARSTKRIKMWMMITTMSNQNDTRI